MLATPHSAHTSWYLPLRSSPLSPRSANAWAVPPSSPGSLFGMSKPDVVEANRPQASVPYSQRAIKSNPLSRRSAEGERDRRRNLFLKQVEKTRDDKRWEGRSEQILRSDYVAERRKWEEEKARAAADYHQDTVISDPEDDEMLISQQSSTGYQPSPSATAEHESFEYMDEVEAVAQQEQMELDTLLALAEQNSNPSQTPVPSSPSTNYDDEELDAIFMDYIHEELPHQQPSVEVEAMDLSNG